MLYILITSTKILERLSYQCDNEDMVKDFDNTGQKDLSIDSRVIVFLHSLITSSTIDFLALLKESETDNICVDFVELSNVHNSDRSSAT